MIAAQAAVGSVGSDRSLLAASGSADWADWIAVRLGVGQPVRGLVTADRLRPDERAAEMLDED